MQTERVAGVDFVFRTLFLGDHNVGKHEILLEVRRKNPGAARGRRQSMPVRNLTFEMFLNRGGKPVLMKVMDTGGKVPLNFTPYRSITFR